MSGNNRLAAAVLILLAASSVYGLWHEHLLTQPMWAPVGEARFFVFTAVYWAAAGLILWIVPKWLGVIGGAFVLVYTAWWTGPPALLATLYFLGSCLLLGRILWRRADLCTSLLLGAAAWMLAIWTALHFPVNTRGVYLAAFAIPYVWEARRLPHFQLRCESRAEAAGLALLGFPLLANWLTALKPEASNDALSMHLALPMSVAQNAGWAFDFHHYTWALMPLGGDSLFTAVYLLGGEASARLLNFGFLALITALIVGASRRWLNLAQAFLAAALFVSTPLVNLVTGSLFVENIWTAMVFGGGLALARYVEEKAPSDLLTAAVLFGAALLAKLIAAVFALPAAAIALWYVWRRRQTGAAWLAAAMFLVFAAPAYVYALVKCGNPIFPYANTFFQSPYFDRVNPFVDPRFTQPFSWNTLFRVTFHSSEYFEARNGSAGFQYLLLLVPAALLARRRGAAAWTLLGIGSFSLLALLIGAPNLRYLYPTFPFFSVIIGLMAAEGAAASALFVVLIALNAWFLPAAGLNDDFAFFRHGEARDFRAKNWPERALIERLNQQFPGEPVAFFSCGDTAGLHGIAYADNWHSSEFLDRLKAAATSSEIAEIVRSLGIRHIIAPVDMRSVVPLRETFLRQWAAPTGIMSGPLELFELRSGPVVVPRELPALPPGTWEDVDARIEYTGAWIHDPQFAQATGHSVTYSYAAGDKAALAFRGSGITYVFTKAVNRGIAAVVIDGTETARIDQYSRATAWSSQQTFDGLAAGTHTFEVRVTGEKNPRSSGTYVDLDQIIVIP